MKSTIHFEEMKIPGVKIGKVNQFPSLRNNLIHNISAKMDKDDHLRIGYGLVPNIMPHLRQDEYGSEMEE